MWTRGIWWNAHEFMITEKYLSTTHLSNKDMWILKEHGERTNSGNVPNPAKQAKMSIIRRKSAKRNFT